MTREARRRPFPYGSNFVGYDFFKEYSDNRFIIYESIGPGKTTADPTVVISRRLNTVVMVK